MSTDPTTAPAEFHYDGYYHPGRLAALLDAVGDMPISDHERRTLHWLSGWEPHTIENLAAMLTRARQTPPVSVIKSARRCRI